MSALGRLPSNSRFYILAFSLFLGMLLTGYIELVRTGSASSGEQIAGFTLLTLLFGLVSAGVTNMLARKVTDLAAQKELRVTVFLCVWLLLAGALLLLPTVADTHEHTAHTEPGATEAHHHE
jgi:drug/metabolite transporter (DMT)-like permease